MPNYQTIISIFFQKITFQKWFPGLCDAMQQEDDEDDDDKRTDSAELVLHEFVYKLKSYFLEAERNLRVARKTLGGYCIGSLASILFHLFLAIKSIHPV